MTGKPDGAARRAFVVAALVIAAMTLLRIIYASAIELRTDEAYYWTWSKETALSFLDHPPMIAWFIRFGTAIFGDTTLGVRFGGIVAMAVTQLLLFDIVRRVTHDVRAVVLAVLMPEAALYYGLLMAKVAPDVAMIPFAVAMMWSLVRLALSGDGRWWLAAGLFAGLSALSKLTAIMFAPAVAAFLLVPDWRWRWLRSPYPYLAVVIAIVVFSPVLIWNAGHDWASFRFQGVRATANYGISLRTVGDYIGLQFGLIGFVMLPVVLTGLVLTAWRGYRTREPVAILLSTAVLVPFLYFLAKSLTLRVGDTWPMFMWPVGFAAAAINLATLSRENWSARMLRSSIFWAKTAVVSGIAFVVIVFLYYVAAPWNLLGKIDPIGAEAGYEEVAARAQAALDETGATWIATTDYRTYAMMRWLFRGRVPVIEINERGRFQDFRDPGMDRIRGHAGIYVGREPDNHAAVWEQIPAKREPLAEVERRWRGRVIDIYALEKLTGWTPDLVPPKDSPLFQWRVLALFSLSPQAGRGRRATLRALSSATDPSRGRTASAAAARRRAAAA
ncbi:glycosyltransferase family 39 protein [Bradyrhizobium sp. CB1650]|uniref:glycosyltransferase family 39 protein n=1 Tax=Bradyrhizobium sp. CB1650 TaxID=3039153 RepID=UPI002434AB40|nr:glycosyltransferase family 39 protein [Bradyrhizobium sp. CB1650]WGD56518.1 glycosyltransferase family 39 protein [Bradyrhizobium sp. CB1650]